MKKVFPAILLAISAFSFSGLWLVSLPARAADKDAPGQNEVLKWKDGKRADTASGRNKSDARGRRLIVTYYLYSTCRDGNKAHKSQVHFFFLVLLAFVALVPWSANTTSAGSRLLPIKPMDLQTSTWLFKKSATADRSCCAY